MFLHRFFIIVKRINYEEEISRIPLWVMLILCHTVCHTFVIPNEILTILHSPKIEQIPKTQGFLGI